MFKIYFIGLKKDLFGCFRIEETAKKDNETGLIEGGGIEMSIYSCFHYAMHALFAFVFTYQRLFLIHFDMHCHRCVLHLISMLHRRLQTF
jgi:hypothetical protein